MRILQVVHGFPPQEWAGTELVTQSLETYAQEIEEIYQELTPEEDAPKHINADQTSPPVLLHERASQQSQPEGIAPVRVSVCIPTYNGAEFLAQAIESVLAQSFHDFELLLVDDGSTDATLEVIRSFADPRIYLYQNEKRLGIPANWNRCLSLARGEYMCLFHQDDVMLTDNLKLKVLILDSDPVISFVHSAAEVRVEDSAPTPLGNWIDDATEDFIADGNVYFRKLFFQNCVCAPAVVARTQQLRDLGGFDETLGYAPDYEMWIKMCTESRVAFLSQSLLVYRWHAQNASHVYRFGWGIEDALMARRRALHHYVECTGRREEGEIFWSAFPILAELERRAAQTEQYIENQQTYIGQLEETRDKLWADVQRVGHGWEEQHRHIEEQQTYLGQLEETRDKLWADVQRVGHGWEEQQTYIGQLEETRDKLWADVQRVGHSWEEQQTYIGQLEELRDKLWTDVQRVGQSWEEQQTYIGQLEETRDKLWADVQRVEEERNRLAAEHARLLSQRFRRLVQKVLRRLRPA